MNIRNLRQVVKLSKRRFPPLFAIFDSHPSALNSILLIG